MAAPLALLDRDGSQVRSRSYAPNIVRITISPDKDLGSRRPGLGSLPRRMTRAGSIGSTASGDEFYPRPCPLEVKAQPSPSPPTQMERYFAPSLPPVSLTVRKPGASPFCR